MEWFMWDPTTISYWRFRQLDADRARVRRSGRECSGAGSCNLHLSLPEGWSLLEASTTSCTRSKPTGAAIQLALRCGEELREITLRRLLQFLAMWCTSVRTIVNS